MSDEGLMDRAREAYEAGRLALAAGDVDAAIEHFAASVEEYPHFKTLELLGEAWLRKGEPRRALVPLAAATSLNAQVRAPSLLAEALLALGNELEAHRMAKIALERDATNRKARQVFEATAKAYDAWSKL
jgi:tetratricopeptide (TPR) repeat protein